MDELGSTLGVEEEFHLVDPDTGALRPDAALSDRAARGELGVGIHSEMLTSQIETATAVCTELSELRSQLIAMRRAASAVAADHGSALLATSSHPFASLSEVRVAERDRYQHLIARHGAIVGEFNLCGCHVHVGVDDLDLAVRIMSRARPYLPVLAALAGSSPFHAGRDTGFDSFRLARLALWPQGGPPPSLASAEEYRTVVRQLTDSGLIDEATEILWDVRPSSRFPTLEFRAADVCTDVDDAVLYAGLVRSLVRTLAGRVHRGLVADEIAEPALRAARWRAARYGIGGQLLSISRGKLVPAPDAVAELMTNLRPDLERHGEWTYLDGAVRRLLGRGTSATRQRQVVRAGGGLDDVVRSLVPLSSGSTSVEAAELL